MKILLVGSGGREHSLAIKLKKSKHNPELFIAPGNAGTAELGKNINIKDTSVNELVDFAKKENIDLTVVGPEAPLVEGITNAFQKENLAIVGPDKIGAQLEGSKAWSKRFMEKYNIPTAGYKEFTQANEAKHYLKSRNTFPIVIKADGLAAGKGVTIAQNLDEAITAIEESMEDKKFASAGDKVVIEDFLDGEEASIFAFCDGKTILPMTPAQDHKAVYEGDKGPNTGGMGAYSPAPVITPELYNRIKTQVFDRVLEGFKSEGIDYRGIVYAGLMIVNNEPFIIEFNARFGDPETQVVLPRLKNDLVDIFNAMVNQSLDNVTLEWNDNPAVCVVMASKGYPGSYEKNKPISGTQAFSNVDDIQVIHAGTKKEDGSIVSNGGRVLGVVSLDASLKHAVEKAYNAIEKISFDNQYYRKDIAHRALH